MQACSTCGADVCPDNGGGGGCTDPQNPSFFLVRERVTFLDAVELCPQRIPGSQLAQVLNDEDYRVMSQLLIDEFPNPDNIYTGGWIGLNAYGGDHGGVPLEASQAGIPATGWRWVSGTDINGPLATPDQLHWGPVGTGYSGNTGNCVSANGCSAENGFLRAQPDNSGGLQRCVLIAVGNIPPTLTSAFYDDQRCAGCLGGGCDGIPNVQEFICERRRCPPPGPSPSPPPFPPPFPPATCQAWCNQWTCGMSACSTCGASICGGR